MIRKLLIVLLLIVASAAPVLGGGAVARKRNLTEGMQSYWSPFTEDVTDATNDLYGTSNTFSNYLGRATVDSTNAYDVGTGNGYGFVMKDQPNLGTTYSVSAWLRPDLPAIDANVFNAGWCGARGSHGAAYEWSGGLLKTTHLIGFSVYGINNGQGLWGDNNSDLKAYDDTWHHIVGLSYYSGGRWNVEAYIDGVSNGSSLATSGYTPGQSSNYPAVIGDWGWTQLIAGSAQWNYHGKIGSFRMYPNKQLTATEIKKIYDIEKRLYDFNPAQIPGLWAWFEAGENVLEADISPAEDTDAAVLWLDQSGQGHDLTLNAAAVTYLTSPVPHVTNAASTTSFKFADNFPAETVTNTIVACIKTDDSQWMFGSDTTPYFIYCVDGSALGGRGSGMTVKPFLWVDNVAPGTTTRDAYHDAASVDSVVVVAARDFREPPRDWYVFTGATADNGMNGDVYAMAVYTNTFTDLDLENITAYWKRKYDP